MDVQDLSDKLIAKAMECKSTDEIRELAYEHGMDLAYEDLEAVAGGTEDYCECFSAY